jgi:hypothetical protein
MCATGGTEGKEEEMTSKVTCQFFSIDNGEWYTETVLFTGTFKACYDQYAEHNGKPVELVRVIDQVDDDYDADALPQFAVRLPDGSIIEAWPEEVVSVLNPVWYGKEA